MSISITVAEVKRKSGIDSTDASYDSSITSLIAEMQGALEYSIAGCYLDDTTNASLQATLKLAMLEMIAGEFIEQLRREIGSTEQFAVAGLSIGECTTRGVDLIQQGAARLSPYLKSTLPMMSDTHSLNSSSDREMILSENEGVW